MRRGSTCAASCTTSARSACARRCSRSRRRWTTASGTRCAATPRSARRSCSRCPATPTWPRSSAATTSAGTAPATPTTCAASRSRALARVIAVADSYNAMTSDRPYRGPMTPEQAIEQLVRGQGHASIEVGPVDAFLRVLERAPGGYRRGQFVKDFETASRRSRHMRVPGVHDAARGGTTSPLKPRRRSRYVVKCVRFASCRSCPRPPRAGRPRSADARRSSASSPTRWRGGLNCDLRLSDGDRRDRRGTSPRGPSRRRLWTVLAECVKLAPAAARPGRPASRSDARGFAHELGRVTAAARWRGHDASLAVFDSTGSPRAPGDRRERDVAHVGALALRAVRPGRHRRASRCRPLRAAACHARGRSRRARPSGGCATRWRPASEYAATGVACGTAGFRSSTKAAGDDCWPWRVSGSPTGAPRRAYEGPGGPDAPAGRLTAAPRGCDRRGRASLTSAFFFNLT